MNVVHLRGTAQELHHRPVDEPSEPPSPPSDVQVWICDVTRPAIVLGSRQNTELLDLETCARDGVDVVHRRSGGGLVFLEPGAMRWIDVVVPATSPWWTDDVSVSMIRLGDVWLDALGAIGSAAARPYRLDVHRGSLQRTPIGELVCFASLGPGEITLDGAKLLGLSARRTRNTARFQCLVHERWNPHRFGALLASGGVAGEELDGIRVATMTDLGVSTSSTPPCEARHERGGGQLDELAAAVIAALDATIADHRSGPTATSNR